MSQQLWNTVKHMDGTRGKYGTKMNAGSVWRIKPEGQIMLRKSYKIMAGNVELVACHRRANVNFSHSTPWRHVCFWRDSPQWARASSGFLDHTQRRTSLSRTPLDEWSARHRDLDLTTHNTHKKETSMPPVRFEPTISAGERPQTYAWDRPTTGTGTEARTGY